MTVINLWLDNRYTEYADLDSAIEDFGRHPLDHRVTVDLEGLPKRQTSEMELLRVQREAELAAEKRAEAQDHARVGAL